MAPRKAKTAPAEDKAAETTVAEASVAETKAVEKAPAKKAAAKKTAAAKTTKTTAAKKAKTEEKAEAPKEEEKKTVGRKSSVKTSLTLQFAGKEFTCSEKSLADAAKKAYEALGNKESDIKSINLYLKVEEGVAYYTVNGEGSDDYKIEL